MSILHPLHRLPIGFAGVLAGCFGVAGAVVGMSEVWYTGPLGKDAGAEFGADLGFEVRNWCMSVSIGTIGTDTILHQTLCSSLRALRRSHIRHYGGSRFG